MLTTDAYAFLNINDPVCAWATYRRVLVSAQEAPGFVSIWSAGIMRTESPQRLAREFALEQYRRLFHPEKISRLQGMFCFLDLKSAEGALSWGGPGNHFRPEYLAELSLTHAGQRRDRFDANWVVNEPGDWISRYWAGEGYPAKEPIWETLIDGRMVVLGTDLVTRAYDVIKRRFPDSLTFLEIARIAARVGSDLGNIFAHLREDSDDLVLSYGMDMREAGDPEFLSKLERYKNEGNPINWADIAPNFSRDSFGKTPDLTPFGFRRPKVAMPYVGPPPSALDPEGAVKKSRERGGAPDTDELPAAREESSVETALAASVGGESKLRFEPENSKARAKALQDGGYHFSFFPKVQQSQIMRHRYLECPY